MIYYIGRAIKNSSLFFTTSTFEDFVNWISKQHYYQHDLESNVCNSIVERKMTLAQYGSYDGRIQWVLDVRYLANSEAKKLIEIMNNPNQIKLIQNASFEYQLWKKYGVTLSNVQDTMLMEKVKWCGFNTKDGFYSLAGLCHRYLGVELDKTLQTSFGSETFNVEQIYYAADDVKYLGHIRNLQLYYDGDIVPSLTTAKLLNVVALENEAVCGFSEIEVNGMRLDQDKWRENISLAQPVIDEALNKLEGFLRSEEFKDKVIGLGYLTDKDELAINWNSTLDKKKVFNKIIPELEGITQPIIKKYIKGKDLTSDYKASFLQHYLEKDYSNLDASLILYYKDWLIEQDLLIPTNTSKINWQSPPQRLAVFKIVEPQLKSTDKQELADCNHPIIEAYQEYINATKLKTTYGEEFISKYVDSDGRVRTHFNQILNTGRVSSSNANIQQVPANEAVGNRYRNAFIADKGWSFVDSDYKSMELIAIAYFSKDKVWLEALSNFQDLHSVCGAQVFGKKWEDATEEGCKYYQLKEDGTYLKDKCKCKGHKTLRTLVKTISFGLAFGMSKFKLSTTAKISLEDAAKTIEDYFNAFPGIKGILNAFANYGVRNGYIMTPAPFNRRRYFDYWEGNQHDRKLIGKIDRASRNLPIQGGSADIAKIALVLIDHYIKDNKLQDKVKLVAQCHDQITTNVVDNYADTWLPIMDKLMRDAANFIIPGDILTADTFNTGSCWSK